MSVSANAGPPAAAVSVGARLPVFSTAVGRYRTAEVLIVRPAPPDPGSRSISHEYFVHFVDSDRREDVWVPASALDVCRLRKPGSIRTPRVSKRRISGALELPPSKRRPPPLAESPPRSPLPSSSDSEPLPSTLSPPSFANTSTLRTVSTVTVGRYRSNAWYASSVDAAIAPLLYPPRRLFDGVYGSALETSSRTRPSAKGGGVVVEGVGAWAVSPPPPAPTLRPLPSTRRCNFRCTRPPFGTDIAPPPRALPHAVATALQTRTFTPTPLTYCAYCLSSFESDAVTACVHSAACRVRSPPGREVYRDEVGCVSLFAVSGSCERAYCERLAALSRLFLEHKLLRLDTSAFTFYVLCEWGSEGRSCEEGEKDKEEGDGGTARHALFGGYRFVGYFSREDTPSEAINVSCIAALPAAQRRGYGRLLVQLSYAFSVASGSVGTPEKPLSDLGRVVYNSTWSVAVTAALLRAVAAAASEGGGEDVVTEVGDGDRVIVFPQGSVGAHREGDAAEDSAVVCEGDAQHTASSVQCGPFVVPKSTVSVVLIKADDDVGTAVPMRATVPSPVCRVALHDLSMATGIRMDDLLKALHADGLLVPHGAQDALVVTDSHAAAIEARTLARAHCVAFRSECFKPYERVVVQVEG